MQSLREHIVDTLEELGKLEFETFKSYLKKEFEHWWHLQQCVNVDGLRDATRAYTADLIVHTYTSNGAQIMCNVLQKIHRKDLLSRFPSTRSTDAPTLSLGLSAASRPVQPPPEPFLFGTGPAASGHGGPALQTTRNIISIGSEDVVLCDGLGSRTTGVGFWRLNGRKIAALCESSYQDLMRKRRMSRTDDEPREKVEELERTEAGLQTDLQEAGQKVTLTNMRSTFLCIICRDVMRNPVVAPCCRSLIGCGVCVAQWTRNTPTCPKCRNEAFPDSLFEITGMEGVIAALRDTVRSVKTT